jgi:hypothetical protein
MVSPDVRFSATTCLMRARCTQEGYGVMVPDSILPLKIETPDDDGLYITDNETGKCKILVSIKDILDKGFRNLIWMSIKTASSMAFNVNGTLKLRGCFLY